MAYLIYMTAAGHRLAVNPRRQKVMLRDIQDACSAEARVGERCVSYNRYRASRGAAGECIASIDISLSARKRLEELNDSAFRRIDAGICRLQKRPTAAGTKPKYYRWFTGDLRRVLIDEFPVLYTFNKERLTILLFGLPRWTLAPKRVRSVAKEGKSACIMDGSSINRKHKTVQAPPTP